ncbi:MAG: TRAP transporter substrate-binding protein DctP [Hydrogenophaga sp.]|uniref:TRAP transporter substrate-binding protein DctP n=1 Tax=Hydrogenophaga sp. TaxID=1904254 RepID=UPI002719D5BA|nr:TRAP transporter substrate-binding protein DctP [Hydrogenophaga sp.]MDO9570019.1 TRAP transporter substrate-binding protein DctP [Hydrogenophaga sp.]MDP3372788.1 TRAP transporter substrate-binding protein DctP [Hydrogenophaga sp.]
MKNPINRRALLGAATALCAAALPTLSMAQAKIELIYSDTVTEADPRATILKDVFGKSLGPEFDFKPYFGATLFKQGTEPVAMQRGNLHLANLAAFDVQKQIPAWSIVTTAYVFRDHIHMKKVFDSDVGKELFAMMEKQMGIKVLSVPYIGTRHVGLKPKKKINTPADLAGIKLRMPPGEGWQFVGTAMGANPTPLAFTEVYTALQTGAIDGQDNPMGAVKSMKFYEVSSQIVKTGHLIANNLFAISLAKWNSLGPAQQKTVQEAADKFAAAVTAQALKDDSEQEAFMKQQGLDVYSPDVAAFRKHVLDVYSKSKFAADWPAGMLDRINKL